MFKLKKAGPSLLGMLFVVGINNSAILSAAKNDKNEGVNEKTFYITKNLDSAALYELSETGEFDTTKPMVFAFTGDEDDFDESNVKEAIGDPGYERPGYSKVFLFTKNKLTFDHWTKDGDENALKENIKK